MSISIRPLVSGLILLSLIFTVVLNPARASEDWNHAYHFGFTLNPKDLKLNEPVTKLTTKDDVYIVDSAAVVDAPAEKIFLASLDYDHYKDFAPYVLDGYVVEANGGTEKTLPTDIYIWTRMLYRGSYMGIKKTMDSKYYLHVQPRTNVLEPHDFALRWTMEPRHRNWKFPTEPYFSILDGSWYIVPLDSDTAYVRYFIKIRTDTWVPNRIVRSVLKDSLEPGVKALILALKDRAKKH